MFGMSRVIQHIRSNLPPLQVGVWIPKAKAGPVADHFRPVGMPNTIDRLVDGSIAAYVMRHTAHLMHPAGCDVVL